MRSAILRSSSLIFVAVLLGSFSYAQSGSSRGPSTPEERARAVQIAHKLESNPLDESLRSDREWAILWLIQVPDIHVSLCTNVLGDFMKSRYKYSSELLTQLTLSSAAFLIEHPESANDSVAQYTGGTEGVLKAYHSILQQKPKATSRALDNLVQAQSDGKLADRIRESSKGCK